MKKRILLLMFLLLILPIKVMAKNIIYSVDMNINIDKNGTANIKEVWDVQGSDGSEWYKSINNLKGSEIFNFKVAMDEKDLIYKEWDIDETLAQKKGYYGINYTNKGQELCFGKYDYKRHIFTLNYTISNFVFNTNDNQVIYFNLMGNFSNVDFRNFNVTISSFDDFKDSLDVWGYGYKGYAYVRDGKIQMSNEENTPLGSDYVVLLAKFPLNTFETTYITDYKTFDEIYNLAETGTYKYDYGDVNEEKYTFLDFISSLISFIIISSIIVIGIKSHFDKAYGYRDNKKIDKNNTPMFRDIPCHKDIYYANALIKLNSFDYKETNILGAIILKWVKNNKVVFKNVKSGIFNKETSALDLTLNPTFDNEDEKNLFDMMYTASKDGILESKEMERFCRNNYSKFFNFFKRMEENYVNKLKDEKHIYPRNSKEECKYKNVMDDTIYEDSKQLYGLKLFFREFAKMDTKEVLEVHLWDEYLMFAYLFGMADKIGKQLKNLYPEVLEQNNFDYDTIIFVNHLSSNSVKAASSARSAAQSYSAGGGGFSSGGGGGGSFGGGGGGSR